MALVAWISGRNVNVDGMIGAVSNAAVDASFDSRFRVREHVQNESSLRFASHGSSSSSYSSSSTTPAADAIAFSFQRRRDAGGRFKSGGCDAAVFRRQRLERLLFEDEGLMRNERRRFSRFDRQIVVRNFGAEMTLQDDDDDDHEEEDEQCRAEEDAEYDEETGRA